MLKLPKFEKCTAKNDLRPSIQYVCIEPDYTVVTDAYKLLWTRSEYPPDLMEFIEKEEAIYIHADQWKKVSGKEAEFIAVDNHAIVFKDSKKGQKIFLEYITKHNADFQYSDWKSILPVDLDTGKARFPVMPSTTVGVDINHLKSIQEAWGGGKDVTYRLDFFGPSKNILVTQNSKEALHWTEQGAVLAPCIVENIEGWLPCE